MIQFVVDNLESFEVNGLQEIDTDKYRYFDVLECRSKLLVSEIKLLPKDYIYDEVMELNEQLGDLPLGEELELEHQYVGINGMISTKIDSNLLFDFIKIGLIEERDGEYFRTQSTVLELIERNYEKYLKSFNQLVRKSKTF